MSDIDTDKPSVLRDRDGDGVIDLPPLDDYEPQSIDPEKKRELDQLFAEADGKKD